MQIKHDYKIINRAKKEKHKAKEMFKRDVKITDKYIEYMERIAKEEKESGIDKCVKSYKGNKLQNINKYLYDTTVMPKERVCYKYKASPIRCKGKLRDHRIVEVNFIQANNGKPQFFVKITDNDNNILEFSKARQCDVVNEIKKIIGDE